MYRHCLCYPHGDSIDNYWFCRVFSFLVATSYHSLNSSSPYIKFETMLKYVNFNESIAVTGWNRLIQNTCIDRALCLRKIKEEWTVFFRSNRKLLLFIVVKFSSGETAQQIQSKNNEDWHFYSNSIFILNESIRDMVFIHYKVFYLTDNYMNWIS